MPSWALSCTLLITMLGGRGRWVSEFKASLVYRVRSGQKPCGKKERKREREREREKGRREGRKEEERVKGRRERTMFSFISIFLVHFKNYIHVCYLNICAHECRCPQRLRESIRSSGLEVTGGLSPLKEPNVLNQWATPPAPSYRSLKSFF